MENSIYIGISRQMALRSDMNVIANNVANMNTTGYRGQNLLFREFISDPRGQENELSFVQDFGQYNATSPGPMKQTGNPLDVALTGNGFFAIEGPGGEAYSRAGEFTRRADGTLITPRGYAVSGLNGGPIVIPVDAQEVNIDKAGRISTEDGEVGQLKIVEFANLQDLEPLGDNLYTTEAPPAAAQNTIVSQGYLEGSNVNGVLEMTRMIETLRSHQSIQRMIENENERLRSAIRSLTQDG